MHRIQLNYRILDYICLHSVFSSCSYSIAFYLLGFADFYAFSYVSYYAVISAMWVQHNGNNTQFGVNFEW